MNNEFDNYGQIDDAPIGSTEALQIHLEEYSRRLSTAISRTRAQNNRVSFTLNDDIVSEIRGLSMLEDVSLSEMCNILLTEHMTQS